ADAAAGGRVLDRVREQVSEDLAHTTRVGGDRWEVRRCGQGAQVDAGGVRGGLVVLDGLADQTGEVDAPDIGHEAARLGAGEQEHVIDDDERFVDGTAQSFDPLALVGGDL